MYEEHVLSRSIENPLSLIFSCDECSLNLFKVFCPWHWYFGCWQPCEFTFPFTDHLFFGSKILQINLTVRVEFVLSFLTSLKIRSCGHRMAVIWLPTNDYFKHSFNFNTLVKQARKVYFHKAIFRLGRWMVRNIDLSSWKRFVYNWAAFIWRKVTCTRPKAVIGWFSTAKSRLEVD